MEGEENSKKNPSQEGKEQETTPVIDGTQIVRFKYTHFLKLNMNQ